MSEKIGLTDVELSNYLRVLSEISDNSVTTLILSSVGVVLNCSILDNERRKFELLAHSLGLGVACIKDYGTAKQIAETEEALNTAQVNALASSLFKGVIDKGVLDDERPAG